MKIAEMRELKEDELNAQIETARKSLFEARMKLSLHQLENTAELSQLKHRIAQLKTVLSEKGRKK
jgi:large subunit ribosomal protein L29